MEKVFTLNELKALKEKSLQTAFDVLKKQATPKKKYTAKELSELCGGIMSAQGIAARVGYVSRYFGGTYNGTALNGEIVGIKSCQKRITTYTKRFAELDDKGNIVRTFERTFENEVCTYEVV